MSPYGFLSKQYLGIYSIQVEACKLPPYPPYERQLEAAKEFVELSLVDRRVPSEMRLLDLWLQELTRKKSVG